MVFKSVTGLLTYDKENLNACDNMYIFAAFEFLSLK